MPTLQSSHHGPKRHLRTTNYDRRITLRVDDEIARAASDVQSAVQRASGRTISQSAALRMLILDNGRVARALAGDPESWPVDTTVDLPRELWDGLTECRNAAAHAQGSLYGILRAANASGLSASDHTAIGQALTTVQESRDAIERLEELAVAYVTGEVSRPAAPVEE